MIIALGADAAPLAPLDDIIAACERRGIGAVCLDVHDVAQLQASGERLRDHGLALAAFRLLSVEDVVATDAARTSIEFNASLLTDERIDAGWLAEFVSAGGMVANDVELNPALHNVAEQFKSVASRSPSHIILRGGGPEAAQFEGRGIGSLMTHLTLTGFAGVLMLSPSGPGTRTIWKTWLFNRSKWGCGSKTSDPALVELQ